MGSVSDFHAALRSLAHELGKQEVHLAELGSHMQRKLPGFTPATYGYANFTELVASATEIGALRYGRKPEDRWFVFGGMGQSEGHEIVTSVWDACVDIEESHRAWLDLMDCVHVETDADKVADESERYLEMPRFGRARQVSLLKSFADGNGDVLAIAERWGAAQRPYAALIQELQALELRRAWFGYLRQAVAAELRAWASEHAVPPTNLFEPRSRSMIAARSARAPGLRTFGMDEHELRAFLRAAIDEMTLAELGQWPVPARLLLTKLP